MSVSNTTKRVKETRRNTRRKFSSEEKIRIVLEGFRGHHNLWRPKRGKSPLQSETETRRVSNFDRYRETVHA